MDMKSTRIISDIIRYIGISTKEGAPSHATFKATILSQVHPHVKALMDEKGAKLGQYQWI